MRENFLGCKYAQPDVFNKTYRKIHIKYMMVQTTIFDVVHGTFFECLNFTIFGGELKIV